MLEEERHASIKQREKVSVCSLVVNELSFVLFTEAAKEIILQNNNQK